MSAFKMIAGRIVQFLIVAFTVILLVAILFRGKDKSLIKRFIKFLRNVKEGYKYATGENEKISKVICIITLITYIIITLYILYVQIYNTNGDKIPLTIFATIIAAILLYYIVGIPLLIIKKIDDFIRTIEDTIIRKHLSVSFIILVWYSLFFVSAERYVTELWYLVLIGLAIAYLLNLRVILEIVLKPVALINKKINSGELKKSIILNIWIGAIIVLLIIIINLFLSVLVVYKAFPNEAYNHTNIATFDLFYYTLITFTTVGYGDIVPNMIITKILSVVISFTSVFCIVVFLGSLVSLNIEKEESL
ncbi:potassium channel family protein [Abyssisolibacter fermentans]|uniref:potassium channel family protein n=1 Tax=Abyssisolibacter fermentans TaxID=1766203 RepID=UPI0012E3AE92|nr:potassium channel family protein [Abyssisolibacter fermentans]